MRTFLVLVMTCGLAAGVAASRPQAPAPGAAQPNPAPQAPAGRGAGPRGGGAGAPRDAQAAQAVTGTASISGVVTLEGSVSGVRRAQVNLSGMGRGGRSTTTNERGQFSFVALPAGRYTLNVSKPGFASIAYGAKKPGRQGTPIQLAEGQALNNAHIRLPKGGVITGVVVDDLGEPAPNTQVRAFRSVIQNGERTLTNAGNAQTDDRGIYRIFQLLPGEYLVSAVPRNSGVGDIGSQIRAQLEPLLQQVQASGGLEALAGGGRGGRGAGAGGLGALLAGGGRGQQLIEQVQQLQQQLAQQPERSTAYAPVYYPGTTTATQASKITIESGQEHGAVDFQLQLVPTATVEGRIGGFDPAQPPGNVQVMLQVSRQQAMPGLNTYNSRMNTDGSFQFRNVTPGQYRVQVRVPVRQPEVLQPDVQGNFPAPAGRGRGPGGRGGRGAITQVLWASADVEVDGRDVSDLSLTLQPGMTITGRVAFDGVGAPPADATMARVNLAPMDNAGGGGFGAMPQQVDAAGNFSIAGVVPGRYSLRGNVAGAGRAAGGGGVRAGGPPTAAAQGTGGSWTMKSAIINGVDTLDFPLEIEPNQNLSGAMVTFTDRVQELTGTLQDAMGRPAPDHTIVLFPADNRYWVPQSRRILSTRPGTDGAFSFRGLPPGQYRLTAVTDAEPGEWYDPTFLTQVLPASIAVTISEGEKKTQDIRLATASEN